MGGGSLFLGRTREQLSNEYLIIFFCALEVKICSPSLARLSDKPIRAHHFEDPDKLGRLERRALSSPEAPAPSALFMSVGRFFHKCWGMMNVLEVRLRHGNAAVSSNSTSEMRDARTVS